MTNVHLIILAVLVSLFINLALMGISNKSHTERQTFITKCADGYKVFNNKSFTNGWSQLVDDEGKGIRCD